MIKRFLNFLGPAQAQNLFFLLAITGTISLVLNAVEGEWVRPVQTLLLITFLGGAAVIFGSRLDPFARGRWIGALLPAFGVILLAGFFFPSRLGLAMGAAFGWIIAALFLFKPRSPMEYQNAVKHLRKNNYDDAVKAMDMLIKQEPTKANHYRFRAEILRLWGKLDKAKRDYEKMTQLAKDTPEKAVAFNGLAEVLLQAGNYPAAHEAALKAYDLAPGEWVTAYNLGMIEDRMQESQAALEHLNLALRLKVKDARHRLLIHFYLARAHSRLGDFDAARAEVANIVKQRNGLKEWQTILESDQAETLRVVLADDIKAAEALADGQIDVTALSDGRM